MTGNVLGVSIAEVGTVSSEFAELRQYLPDALFAGLAVGVGTLILGGIGGYIDKRKAPEVPSLPTD